MDLATQRRLIERYDADYVYEEEVWEEVSGVSVLILLDLIQFVCWFPLSGRGQAGHSSNLSVFAPSFTRHLFPLFQIYCPKIPHFRQIPLSTWVWLQIGYPKTTNVLSSFSPFLMTVLRFGQIFFRATGTRPSKLNFKKIGNFESYQVTWGFPIKKHAPTLRPCPTSQWLPHRGTGTARSPGHGLVRVGRQWEPLGWSELWGLNPPMS